MDLSHRSTEPELMDDPRIKLNVLREVLYDISNVNKILNGNGITIKAVAKLLSDHPKTSYTFLDFGCGDGSMLREVALFCRKNQINAKLTGVDLNEKTIQIARESSKNFPEIQYMKQDVLELDVLKYNCDIVLCTLTLHHFTNEEIVTFTQKTAALAALGVIVNDLHRSKPAYYLYKGFSAIFIKTKIAKYDGLISIKRGFTKNDLTIFSKKLPMSEHKIKWKWAFRYVWVITPKRPSF